MNENVLDALHEAISHAQGMYSRLILMVGPSGTGKTKALQELSTENGKNITNVNLEMSRRLLELPVQRRGIRASQIFKDVVRDAAEGAPGTEPAGNGRNSVVLLDNLEILFDKDLNLNPLVLLEAASRNTTIVASWNGSYTDRKLTFARAGHPEYRYYDTVNGQIIEFDKDEKQ
jgi:DNA polymerase III delta prime subunit